MATVRIIAFTGHRPNKLGGYDPGNPIASRVIERLDRCIRAAVQCNGTRVFLSGMALGVDQWAAQLVSLYRAESAHRGSSATAPFWPTSWPGSATP